MTELPNAIEAERGLLAKLLVEPKSIPLLADRLKPEDFYVEENGVAYRGMLSLSADRKTVDIISLRRITGRPELDVPVDFLTIGHSASVEEYAELIREAAFQRRIVGFADSVKGIGYRGGKDVLAQIQDGITNLVRGAEQGSLVSPGTAAAQYLENIIERNAGKIKGLQYGFTKLDTLVQPAGRGDMVIIAARPSVGKTAFAESVADFWSTQSEFPILFCSLEMGINQILDRTVSRYTGIPAQLIIRGTLNEGEMERVRSTMQKIEERQVWYLDDSFATTGAIRAACAKVRLMTGGLSGVVVDYLSLLKDSGDQEVQRVTRISRNLKAIAREFNVPMLVLSQLNRAVESREDKHPRLYDLRESGAIEQDADLVLGLSRQLGTPYMDVEVLKNRQGPLDMIKLWFDPDRVTFHEQNPNPEPELKYNPETRSLDTVVRYDQDKKDFVVTEEETPDDLKPVKAAWDKLVGNDKGEELEW